MRKYQIFLILELQSCVSGNVRNFFYCRKYKKGFFLTKYKNFLNITSQKAPFPEIQFFFEMDCFFFFFRAQAGKCDRWSLIIPLQNRVKQLFWFNKKPFLRIFYPLTCLKVVPLNWENHRVKLKSAVKSNIFEKFFLITAI